MGLQQSTEAVMNSEFYAFSFFEHANQVKETVQEIIHGTSGAQMKILNFQTMLSHYQEQAELLDPHLESIITPLTQALLDTALKEEETEDGSDIRNICVLLQCVSKVRGHKSVVKFYPVDVKCFVPILNLLSRYQSIKGEGVWETQCQLMLWLSSLTLIPFDLRTLASDGASVVDRIMEIADGFLREAGTVREFAGLLLYRLLTRPDMDSMSKPFMQRVLETLRDVDEGDDVLYAIGVTQAVSFVFKHGQRRTLLPHAREFWPVISSLRQSKAMENSLLLRKLGIKLAQRLALTLLEPITPKWRYVQTTARLGGDTVPVQSVDEEAHEYDIPEEIEDVIQLLLVGIADKDTSVRWSASKGLGRVCGRLPKELANEVLSFVLELFSESADDSTWHGACLSVAELARRGLLLPESIPALVPLIEKALVYDVNRGSYSIGAHVRDSACYVCWACARSFDAEIMSPFMPKLAPVLMTTACLDREVNCRRAASAAFQECVGRIGNVPEGIAILEVADYFTLSKRPNAYLTVAPAVARFASYGFDFIAHLLFEKVRHWDPSLRQLTADTLAKLVEIDLEYFACDGLDHLLAGCLDANLDLRHGACLSLASILQALVENEAEIPEDRLTAVANLVVKIEKARLYRGKGGSLMRQATSRVIESIAASHLSRSLKHRLRLLKTLNECIGHPEPDVPQAALKALHALSREFPPEEIEEGTHKTTRFYLEHLHSENVAFRRGYTAAMGSLPRALLLPDTHECIEALCKATEIEEDVHERDAESRANAVKALTEVVCELYPEARRGMADVEYLSTTVMETFFSAMEDYSIDRRGDVGSWIRDAAMQGMRRIAVILAEAQTLQPNICTRIVAFLLRNSVERISNIRHVAVQNLIALLDEPCIELSHRKELEKLKAIEGDAVIGYGTSKGVEPMVAFLRYSEFRVALLEGLMATIGGLEKSLSESVAASLSRFLEGLPPEEFEEFMSVFLTLCTKHNRCKRMATPVLTTIDAICKSPSVFERMTDTHKSQLVKIVKSSIASTSDFTRLLTGCSVLTILAFQETQSAAAWKELLVLLVNKFPFIRKQTAEIIYEKLLFQEDTPKTNALSQALLEAAWDVPIDHVMNSRQKLCEILQIEAPVRKAKASKKSDGLAKAMMTDENASYKALVEDFARGI